MPRIRWTPEEDERLLSMISAGKSWTFITAALRRETSSIKLRVGRLRRAAAATERNYVELGLKAKK